ncbi:MAG TPA: hypothetical protein VK623_01065 [Flavobacterium sp.]|nr:hypothetical protein [Flavobacterium sp.]
MKKLLLLLVVAFTSISYSQNQYSTYRPSSGYQAESFESMSSVPLQMRNRSNENLKYLYNIKGWIAKVKEKINQTLYIEFYIQNLDKIYNYLTSIQDKDLSNAYQNLHDIEDFIDNQLIPQYVEEVKKKN